MAGKKNIICSRYSGYFRAFNLLYDRLEWPSVAAGWNSGDYRAPINGNISCGCV